MTKLKINNVSHLGKINEQLDLYTKIIIKETDRRNESFKNFKQNVNSQIIPIYISISVSVTKKREKNESNRKFRKLE